MISIVSRTVFLKASKLIPILIILTVRCFAQGFPSYEQTVIPSTPDASALSRYIDYPVSMSTGVPQISLPLYTLTSKKLSVPISLSYHAGGIKVSDKSVTMGAGWTLNAGGAISRVVRDIPDESPNGFLNMIYPDESLNTTAYKDYCLANGLINIYTDGAVKLDGEPDIFYYNFLNQGGKFLFRNKVASGVAPQAVPIPYSPIKINWPQIPQACTITGTNGDTYRFEYVGDNYYLPSSYLFDPNRGTTPMAWYLTKIVSADKTDSISFVYETGTPNHVNYTSHTAQARYLQLQIGNPGGAASMNIANGITDYTLNTSRLKSITSLNGKVQFTYDNTTGRLNKVDIYSLVNNTLNEIKSFQVNQSQFDNCTRTRLDSISETGYVNNSVKEKLPPYKFSYFSSDAPPDFTYAQDIWGFYNGKNGNSDMLFVKDAATLGASPGVFPLHDFIPAPEKRAADATYTKKGVLTRITYPTGGYTNFTFDPNQLITTVNVDTVIIPPAISHGMTNFDMAPGNPTQGVSVTFKPQSPHGLISLTASVFCHSGSCTSAEALLEITDLNTNTIVDAINLGHFNDNKTYHNEEWITLDTAHTYKLFFPTPGLISNYNQTPYYRLDGLLQEGATPVPTTISVDNRTVLAGGLRVSKIEHNDGKGATLIKTYNYTKPYFNSEVYQGNLSYIMSALMRDQYTFGSTGSSSTLSFYTYIRGDRYKTFTEGTSIPIGGVSNSSVSYQEIEEIITGNDNSKLGKTVYTFNTALDFVDHWFPLFRLDKEYVRTQLLNKKAYKNNASGSFILINDQTNTYNNINDYAGDDIGRDSIKFYAATTDFNFQEYASRSGNARSPNAVTGGESSSDYTPGCKIFGLPGMTFFHMFPFYYHVVRPTLTSTITTNYDLNGQNPLTTQTDYAYDNYAHMFPTRVTTKNSDQKTSVQTTKYVLDYNYQTSCNLQSCLTTFNQQLKVLQNQREQGQQTAAANHDLTSYDQYETSYQNSVQSLVNQYNTCVSGFYQCYPAAENNLAAADKAIAYMQDINNIEPKVDVITTVNGAVSDRLRTDYLANATSSKLIRPQFINVQIGSNTLEQREQYAYDNNGNLSEQFKSAGVHTAYQWGYNATYPVAQVTNSKSNNIFFDSFEEGNGNSTLNDSKTGHYSHTGSYSKALTGLDAGTYSLVYWLKSGSTWSLQRSSINVTGSTATISIPSGQIDDVRFYPLGSLMTTYTYDTLIGMTSSTDTKGETTYFEYDSLLRLVNVKDKDGNIMKHTDYHYAGQ